jgi:DNA-binding transcriptional regulator LsrR (DeoR family)
MSLTHVAKKHGISRASVCRLMKEASREPETSVPTLTGNVSEQASAAAGGAQ